MSRHNHQFAKLLVPLAAAALLSPLGTATAADSTGDFQQQVRDLLSGTHTTHLASQSEVNSHSDHAPAIDAQESARRLLLGTTLSAQTQTQPHNHVFAHEDLQARVQRLLLGDEAKF